MARKESFIKQYKNYADKGYRTSVHNEVESEGNNLSPLFDLSSDKERIYGGIIKGPSHKKGGVDVYYMNDVVNAEGGEPYTMEKTPDNKKFTIFGNLKVPKGILQEYRPFGGPIGDKYKIESKKAMMALERTERNIKKIEDIANNPDELDPLKSNTLRAQYLSLGKKRENLKEYIRLLSNLQHLQNIQEPDTYGYAKQGKTKKKENKYDRRRRSAEINADQGPNIYELLKKYPVTPKEHLDELISRIEVKPIFENYTYKYADLRASLNKKDEDEEGKDDWKVLLGSTIAPYLSSYLTRKYAEGLPSAGREALLYAMSAANRIPKVRTSRAQPVLIDYTPVPLPKMELPSYFSRANDPNTQRELYNKAAEQYYQALTANQLGNQQNVNSVQQINAEARMRTQQANQATALQESKDNTSLASLIYGTIGTGLSQATDLPKQLAALELQQLAFTAPNYIGPSYIPFNILDLEPYKKQKQNEDSGHV